LSSASTSQNRLNLARKYRPIRLEDLIGQSHAVKILNEAFKKDRLAPAYLLSGPRGIGKTSTARIIAKAASCLSKDSDKPCEKCAACKAFSGGNLMDVVEMDGASHTGVDDIRRIIEAVAYRPSVGKRNVYIVDEVHMLSNAAFNALLKTLEEPPAHALFIFATTEIEKLPSTVLSRVQRLELRRLHEAEILESLTSICEKEKIEAAVHSLEQIASAADGSLRDAQTLLEQMLLMSGGKKLDDKILDAFLGTIGADKEVEFLELMARREANKLIEKIGEFHDRGKDLLRLQARLLNWIRQLLIFRSCGSLDVLSEKSPEEYIQKLVTAFAAWSLEDIDRLLELSQDAYARIRQHDFPRFVMETSALRATRIPHTEDISRLIQMIERETPDQKLQPSVEAAPVKPKERARPEVKMERPIAPKEVRPTRKINSTDDFLEELAASRPSLSALVKCAEKTELHFDKVVLTFPHGHFAFKQLGDKLMIRELEKAFSTILSRPVQVVLEENSENASKPQAQPRRKDFIKEAREKAVTDPNVQRAAEILGGKISSVTIEGIKT